MLARTLSTRDSPCRHRYGHPVNVHDTVQMFSEAGLRSIISRPGASERCDTWPGKDVCNRAQARRREKIEAAAWLAVTIVCHHRAHGRAGDRGSRESGRRARAYAEAGADMIFARCDPDRRMRSSVWSMRLASGHGSIWAFASGPHPPLIVIKRLAEIGVRRVTFPAVCFGAAIHGMTRALAVDK